MVNRIVISFCGLFMFVCCSVDQNSSRIDKLPYYNDANFTPIWFNSHMDLPNDFHHISSFSLSNQDGNVISSEDFKNKIYVANFFFSTCPGICPQMTDNMLILHDKFIEDDDILLISHSVMPWIDTVDRLKTYADEKNISSKKWHLLTGDRDLIYKLGRADYYIEEDLGLEKDLDDFLHTENFVLIDKSGYIRGIYNGLKTTDIQHLINDIELLKVSS